MEILLKDGVRYLPHTPKSEEELEESVKYHIKDIFGKDAFYFEKQLIATKSGIGSIPDGFVIDFKSSRWWVIEVELSSHDPYGHAIPQIKKFRDGLNTYKTKEALKKAIFQQIKENSKLRAVIETEDLHKTVWDILDLEPEIIITIEERTDKWAEAIGRDYRIIEFKTYTRENVEGMKVHIHRFEPLTHAPREAEEKRKGKQGRKKIDKTPNRAYRLPILEVLMERGGKGKTKKILQKVGKRMTLKEADYEKLRSGKEIRWRNTVKWERQKMKKEGLLREDSPRGIWEITEKGRRYYEEHKKTQA